jgi:inosine-uridine nucleoside N-ribohydrolase
VTSTPVLLDCDPGHDDAIALLLALASPEIELLGVTTVAGNQTLEKTTANAIRVLDGPDLPPPQREPLEQHAVDFLAEHAAGATLVAVGPLTNVALLLARYPDAGPKRIVLMGGSIGLGNVTPAAEFNIWADPEAAARVFASGLDVTMIGLDVTHEALLLDEHVERLRASGRTGQMVAELYDFFHRFHARTYGFAGSPIHDAVTVAHVIRPDLVRTEHRHVEVECDSELTRGRTVVDLWRRTGNEPNAHVGIGIDGDRFVELLLERLTTLDST